MKAEVNSMSTAPPPEVCITFPLSAQHRELVEQAAALSGQALADFAASTLVEKAVLLLQTGSVRVLSERDALRFVELLDADAEPNEALRSAAERYRKRHG
jgi:uncharacterized protein (DUF1778 family)